VKDATTPRAKGVHQHRTKGESSNQAPHLETWATTRLHEQEPRAGKGQGCLLVGGEEVVPGTSGLCRAALVVAALAAPDHER